jgi:hypothetical protein
MCSARLGTVSKGSVLFSVRPTERQSETTQVQDPPWNLGQLQWVRGSF